VGVAKLLSPKAKIHYMANKLKNATFRNHHACGQNPINNMPQHVKLMF